jgi:hypothetical protein
MIGKETVELDVVDVSTEVFQETSHCLLVTELGLPRGSRASSRASAEGSAHLVTVNRP